MISTETSSYPNTIIPHITKLASLSVTVNLKQMSITCIVFPSTESHIFTHDLCKLINNKTNYTKKCSIACQPFIITIFIQTNFITHHCGLITCTFILHMSINIVLFLHLNFIICHLLGHHSTTAPSSSKCFITHCYLPPTSHYVPW